MGETVSKVQLEFHEDGKNEKLCCTDLILQEWNFEPCWCRYAWILDWYKTAVSNGAPEG